MRLRILVQRFKDMLPDGLKRFFGFVKGFFNNRPLRYMMAIFIITGMISLSSNIRDIITNEGYKKRAYENNKALTESAERLNHVNTQYINNSRKLDSIKTKIDYVQMQLICERHELNMVRDTLYKLNE